MTVFEWQDAIYPVLTLQSWILAGLMVITFYWIERRMVIFILACVFAITGISFAVLTITTGDAPILDIDEFRIWIVRTRIALSIVMLPAIYLQAQRVWRNR